MDDRTKCLRALDRLTRPDEFFVGFRALQRATRLDRATVRRHVRALARKGLARYARGLWSEWTDGPAGAGYAITEAGREAARAKG